MLYPAELRAPRGIIAIGGGIGWRQGGNRRLQISEGAQIRATRLKRAEKEEGRTEVRPYI